MHSAIFALVAISGVVSASPTARSETCEGAVDGKFYTCANNGFRGDCSVDPCAIKWCPDYVEKTCELVFITKPIENPTETEEEEEEHWKPETTSIAPPKTAATTLPDGQCAPGTGFFQVCNGFRGCCKSDACSSSNPGVCPDDKKVKRTDDPTVCAPGTGFFQSCSNGFRGCCKSDACTGNAGVCPDDKTKTDTNKHSEPKTWEHEGDDEEVTKNTQVPEDGVCAPGTGFFQVCANGFKGCCKSDACSQKQPICPPTVTKRLSDPTVCPPGTGFFQSCSNGFRGCCKGDACGNSWCPDFKTGTYQPAQTFKVKARADGTCRPGTGFFQVCANGFKGCCKKDACSQKKPVCPK